MVTGDVRADVPAGEAHDGGTVVATVAGRAITLDDVERRVAAVRRGPLAARLPVEGSQEALRVRRWMVQLLVTEAVVAHEAATVLGSKSVPRPVAPDPSTLTEAILNGADPRDAVGLLTDVRDLFERVTAEVTVPAGDLRAFYEANSDRFVSVESRTVRHVLLGDEDAARQVMARIAGGEDLGDLARALSADRGSRDRGGVLGELSRGEFVGPFEDAVFAAAVGQVVGPIRTEFGWHVLRVDAVRPRRGVGYETVRADLEADLLAAARGRFFDDWLERRRRSLADLHPHYLHPGDPALPDNVHRH